MEGLSFRTMACKPYPRIHAAVDNGAPVLSSASLTGANQLRSTATKRLVPGAPGTKRLLQRFGEALLCVRYRTDPESGRRFTTVELIVEERSGPPAREVWVRVGFGETELRQRIKAAGGLWDSGRKLWRIPGASVKALGLQKRIVKNIQ